MRGGILHRRDDPEHSIACLVQHGVVGDVSDTDKLHAGLIQTALGILAQYVRMTLENHQYIQ